MIIWGKDRVVVLSLKSLTHLLIFKVDTNATASVNPDAAKPQKMTWLLTLCSCPWVGGQNPSCFRVESIPSGACKSFGFSPFDTWESLTKYYPLHTLYCLHLSYDIFGCTYLHYCNKSGVVPVEFISVPLEVYLWLDHCDHMALRISSTWPVEVTNLCYLGYRRGELR